jgi:hypothetical protein
MRTGLALALVAMVGCRSRPAAELVVVVDSDLDVPAELDGVRVSVNGRVVGERTLANTLELPATLTLIPKGDPAEALLITAEGTLGGRVVARQEVHTGFVPGSARQLAIFLAEQCGTSCAPIEVDASALPPFVTPQRQDARVETSDASMEIDAGVEIRPDAGCMPVGETCNGVDDNCDGTIDEPESIPSTDARNCGRCGNVCGDGRSCRRGSCGGRRLIEAGVEASCAGTVPPDATTVCIGDAGSALEGVGPAARYEMNGELRCVRNFDGMLRCFGAPFGTVMFPSVLDSDSLTVGRAHMCVVRSAIVYCAGNGTRGQLDGVGDHSTSGNDALPIVSLPSASEVSSGNDFTCAIAAGGASCWGANECGQLGRGPTAPVGPIMPVRTAEAPLTDLVHISCAGGGAPADDCRATPPHCCALDSAGAVYCWGNNALRQTNPDLAGGEELFAVRLAGVPPLTEIEVAPAVSCGIDTEDRLWCWGDNRRGILGTAKTNEHGPLVVTHGVRRVSLSAPVPVTNRLSSLAVHALALRWDGTILCWGDRTGDACGDGADIPPPTIVEWSP